MSKINNRVKAVRQAKSLNQTEFSNLIGVAKSTLSEIESGKTKPSTDVLIGISNNFSDINSDWLLTGEGEMLKGGGANENFSEEDLRILRMLKRLPPTQKNHQIQNIEVFLQSAEEYARNMIQSGDLRAAA